MLITTIYNDVLERIANTFKDKFSQIASPPGLSASGKDSGTKIVLARIQGRSSTPVIGPEIVEKSMTFFRDQGIFIIFGYFAKKERVCRESIKS